MSYTTRFIDETPELIVAVKRRDRATKLLNYIADVTVNGHPETRGRAKPDPHAPRPVRADLRGPPGRRHEAAARPRRRRKNSRKWMREERRVLVTDTTMRDAHQSLLATRMRTHDIVAVAPAYATALPQLLSLECWGGATFDVAMRFLTEDPWERLATIRARVPNILLQMLLRGANGVGYTNYPDNVVRFFVAEAAKSGHRPLPRLRLPELGREHARRDRRGAGIGKALRSGDLLHRRPPRCRRGRNTISPTM